MPEYIKPAFAIFLIFVVPGAVGGWLAANRARNFVGWSILCALFPIFLMVIYFKKPLREVPGKFRQCPSCHEYLKWRDATCKYCQAELPNQQP